MRTMIGVLQGVAAFLSGFAIVAAATLFLLSTSYPEMAEYEYKQSEYGVAEALTEYLVMVENQPDQTVDFALTVVDLAATRLKRKENYLPDDLRTRTDKFLREVNALDIGEGNQKVGSPTMEAKE